MTAYRVWDAYNGDADSGRLVEASSPEEAALTYARSDRDGACDGLYYGDRGEVMSDLVREGQPIVVQGVLDGALEVFSVGVVELRPVFRAVAVDRGRFL
jgi:hypothetical protein